MNSSSAFALLTALVGNVFETLRIGVTLWDGHEWLPIHFEPNTITRFEFEHGFATERAAYNARMFEEVRQSKKSAIGAHAGYSDLFVPVTIEGEFVGVLVAGPFALTRSSAGDLVARWRQLTGREGRLGDAEFQWYLREALAVLVLDRGRAARMQRFLECYARLMGSSGPAAALTNRAYVLRADLEQARFAERMWAAAQWLLDERARKAPYDSAYTFSLSALGLSRVIDHVVVGLVTEHERDREWVARACRRDAFQRGAVELAKSLRDAIVGTEMTGSSCASEADPMSWKEIPNTGGSWGAYYMAGDRDHHIIYGSEMGDGLWRMVTY